jgi:hypothetical protein
VEEFQSAYDSLIAYVKDPTSWTTIEDELRGRGVSAVLAEANIYYFIHAFVHVQINSMRNLLPRVA